MAASGSTAVTPGLARSLLEFWTSWTGAARNGTASDPASAAFAALVSRAFGSCSANGRAELCAGGTPLEFSVALDSLGQAAARFVCDVTDTGLEPAQIRQTLREAADDIIPASWPAAAALDGLFDRHLTRARPSALFKMWHGAGFSPGKPPMAKLYFNCEWLSRRDVADAIFAAAGDDAANIVAASPYLVRLGCAGIGYDFRPDGLHKVKAYVRVPQFDFDAALEEASRLPGIDHERCRDLMALVSREMVPSAPNYVFSLGFIPALGLQEWKVYLVLGDAYQDLRSAAQLLGSVLARWSLAPPRFDSDLPSRFEPTLLAAGVDGQREMASLYFRPVLPLWPTA